MAGDIRVVVADRRRSVAEMLALGLRQLGMTPVAVTGMRAACQAAADQHADVVVADIGLLLVTGRAGAHSAPAGSTPARSAFTATPWPERLGGVPLVVLSDGTRTDALAGAAIRAGVRGWVPKDSSLQHLLAVIRGVRSGETWIPPRLLTRVLAELMTLHDDQERDAERLATLSAREREVLDGLAAGLSRAEIGRRLFLSTNTVRSHVQNLMTKLDVHSSVAAVALAHRVSQRPS
ncbi:response regulator transcription factor [Streptacidiphilus fuscans]|uniref:Response regulator transcription factor n=1 Tax=Streptacidiphilus fuscans TaxID=2789292 RepID=A0A931B675_9ACTN|nr:response regulator transcription factor [Streptacidiphilus fuscans]MBF9069751.1 response regulator transcription factor [Streptacidiphilus fuscans]